MTKKFYDLSHKWLTVAYTRAYYNTAVKGFIELVQA
jgi:hypothetical protein